MVSRGLDIASKIADAKARQEQAEKENAEKKVLEAADDAERQSRILFMRTQSDPGPAKPAAHGAKITIVDAVKSGDIATIDRMVHQSKSILKETDGTGSRPIHHAARNGRVDVLKVCLS
jgi:hypothetical protein